ncbi:S1C family serine protease [Brachybacterium sp. GCM10030252]|uniref:S1C family serine protease n=1 Tax=Brachybacterium sp. GCM10030252 TaxID=3273380 RepID=UPI003608AB42
MNDMKDEREPYENHDDAASTPDHAAPFFGYRGPGDPNLPGGYRGAQDTPPTEQFEPTPDHAGSGPGDDSAYPPAAEDAAAWGPAAGTYSDPFASPASSAPAATPAAGSAPAATPAAGSAPSAVPPAGSAPRRRGPGWGGVTALVALGMLFSSGATLGGVVAYDEFIDPEAPATEQSTPSPGTTASPTAVSSTEDPDWTAVADQVAPSAVAIQVSSGAGTSQGTGVILDEQGAILTNNHVVTDAESAQVTTSDGLSYSASVVGTDPTTDLAVIRLDSPPEGLQPATFADSSTVTVGQSVMAFGTPLGLENTVTTGIVSALDRPVTASGDETDGSDATYTSAIQTDAAINPGNSGGPLVDAAGQVIGINTAIAGIPNASGQAGSIGLGFAIPSNTAAMIAGQLQADGTADHAYVGVTSTDGAQTVGDVTHRGAEVVSVEPGSPAEQAGLQEGDLITAVDETPVGSAAALTGVVRGLPVDSEHTLTVVRDQDVQELQITLGQAPS